VFTVVGDADSGGSELPKHGGWWHGIISLLCATTTTVGLEWYVTCLEPFQSKLSSQLEPINFKIYLC
jgi:hypothetical protein